MTHCLMHAASIISIDPVHIALRLAQWRHHFRGWGF